MHKEQELVDYCEISINESFRNNNRHFQPIFQQIYLSRLIYIHILTALHGEACIVNLTEAILFSVKYSEHLKLQSQDPQVVLKYLV